MAADGDIAALANALAWPITVGTLLVVYRKKIGDFITKISSGSRLSKFSIGLSSVSIELAEAKRFEPAWTTSGGGDFRQPTIIEIGGSYIEELIRQLELTAPADYFIVDLKNGNDGWISSRLYLFTVMLQKARGVRCVVFVDRYQDIRNHFLGIATSTKVQSALERNYPGLDKVFSEAHVYSEEGWDKTVDGKRANLINGYVSRLQTSKPPVAEEAEQWVQLKVLEKTRKQKELEQSQVWEHASWLDSNKVREMLKEDLQTRWINEDELQRKPNADKARLILSFEGSFFVAIVDEDRRFKKLIDRQPLVEDAIRGIME